MSGIIYQIDLENSYDSILKWLSNVSRKQNTFFNIL